MQPQKPLNIGAPTQNPEPLAPVGPKPVETLANAGGSSDPGAGQREAAEQKKLLFPNRFGTGTPAVPAALSSAASVVLAKMLDYASGASENRGADARAVDAQLASSRAEAAFDGANNKMAQDRELFQAIAKDRAQDSSVESTAVAGADGSKIAKDRAAIREQRAEDQAEFMVLTAEAGGTGDRYNPTLDLTY